MKPILAGILLLAACGGRLDAPFPRPGSSPHDRAIARQAAGGALPECRIPSVDLGETKAIRPVLGPAVVVPIARSWEFVAIMRPESGRARFLDGRFRPFWEWPGGKGIGLLIGSAPTWVDHRTLGPGLSPMLLQLASSSGYIGFTPGDYRMAAIRECGDWAGERPVRVLLFELEGAEDGSRFYGVSAFWRALGGSGWVSLLGLGGHPEARNQFLTLIRQSR